MDDANGNGERKQTFSFETRWFTLRLSGNVILGLTFGILTAVAAGIVFHDVRSQDRLLTHDQGIKEGVKAVEEGINRLSNHQVETTKAQRELNYIMTLSPEERKELNLEMPDSLRDRVEPRRRR